MRRYETLLLFALRTKNFGIRSVLWRLLHVVQVRLRYRHPEARIALVARGLQELIEQLHPRVGPPEAFYEVEPGPHLREPLLGEGAGDAVALPAEDHLRVHVGVDPDGLLEVVGVDHGGHVDEALAAD